MSDKPPPDEPQEDPAPPPAPPPEEPQPGKEAQGEKAGKVHVIGPGEINIVITGGTGV